MCVILYFTRPNDDLNCFVVDDCRLLVLEACGRAQKTHNSCGGDCDTPVVNAAAWVLDDVPENLHKLH